MKKAILYIILVIATAALAAFYALLRKYVLIEASLLLKWLVAVIFAAATVTLYYFGKPTKPEHRDDPRWKNALRCLSYIVLGSAVIYLFRLATSRTFDVISVVIMISIVLMFVWGAAQIQNKFKKEKEHIE